MKNWIIYSAACLFLLGCQGERIPLDPVKEMKRDFTEKYSYTVFLTDMDLVGDQYKHKYTVVTFEKDESFTLETTDWKKVDDNFFAYHESDFGMEVLSRSPDGKYNDLVTPGGFTNFVGNPKYGKWELNGTDNYWDFDPEYDYVKEALLLKEDQLLQSKYVEYKNFYKYNRPYYGGKYGTKDSTVYGTYSRYWLFYRPAFFYRRVQTKNFNKPSGGGLFGSGRGGGGFGK